MARAVLAGVVCLGGAALLVAAALRPYSDNQRNWLVLLGIGAWLLAGVILVAAWARRSRDRRVAPTRDRPS